MEKRDRQTTPNIIQT